MKQRPPQAADARSRHRLRPWSCNARRERHAPGDYSPSVKPSSKGNYHSVSITINATHIEQVETLYEELGNIDIVRMVL